MPNNNLTSVKHVDILRVPNTNITLPNTRLFPSGIPGVPLRSVTKQPNRSRSQSPGTSSITQRPDAFRQPKHDIHNLKHKPNFYETPTITLTPTPPRNPLFNSNELLRSHERSNSTTNLLHLRSRPHSLAPPSSSRRELKTSSSYDDVDTGRMRDTSLENACRNVSNSSRSLLENYRKERAGNVGYGVTDMELTGWPTSRSQSIPINRNTVRREGYRRAGGHFDNEVIMQNVTKMPGSPDSAPIYVFEDSPSYHAPSLLQRSKTFFLERSNSVRQSFRSRTNSATATTSKSAKKVQPSPQPTQRISLVFAQAPDKNNDTTRLSIAHNSKKAQRKSSFVALRKRLFPKSAT